jgi:hypothetical protein
MNKYLLTVKGHTYKVTENRLRSIIVFNNDLLHKDVDLLIAVGKLVVKKKGEQIVFELKKI